MHYYYDCLLNNVIHTKRIVAMMQKTIITLLCAAGMIISNTAAAETLRVRPGAPARYTVKQGDTLWGISGKYLYRPWKWPALWGANRSKIRNPNLIYPGQVLVLTYVNGKPRLSIAKDGGIPTFKLHPRIRDLGSGYAIPTINVNFYHMFMKTPQFMTEAQLAKAGRIVGGADDHLYYSQGNRIYADGIFEDGTYLIFRNSGKIIDPVTKRDLGVLVEFAGEASTMPSPNNRLSYRTAEEQASLGADEYYVKNPKGFGGGKPVAARTAVPMVVDGSLSEIRQGDYLIKKAPEFTDFHYMPHEPANPVNADIISIMDGVDESGAMQTLIINKGEADGVDNGTVFSIYRRGKVLRSDWKSPNPKAAQYVNTPNQEIGLAMVYRTGEHVASAIILESIANVNRGDLLSMPGQDADTFDNRSVGGK